jgi:DNA primase
MTSRDLIDEIKSKLDIVDVIGEKITLHNEGGSVFRFSPSCWP